MEVGIVGLPYVGKTTLFTALTSGAGGAAAGGGVKATVGVAHIPDARLDLLATYIPPKKITKASLTIVDVPGLAPGESATAGKFLDSIRQVDALCHVVRCYDGGQGAPNPASDMESLETELILTDLQVVENALPRAERAARAKEKKALVRFATLQRIAPVLEEGRPIRAAIASGEIKDPDEIASLRELGMISAKKVLYVANVGEDDVTGDGAAAKAVHERAKAEGMESVAVCAKIEAELTDLDESDRQEMLEGLGLKEPALPALAAALYRLLGLQSFYTAGPKEVRAWTVRQGAAATEAAGAIHSDIERGFIRAEIYKVTDLDEFKSEKAIKEAGRMRSEGKNYVMQDGDVAHFLFNV